MLHTSMQACGSMHARTGSQPVKPHKALPFERPVLALQLWHGVQWLGTYGSTLNGPALSCLALEITLYT